ncbi:OLC1v1031735C3 [Oldenlandia corymbosa var. corymbosa]|uniref:O-fucosyltransferase family protein n=1 Tax=Oldenlandia corymbosa var. corymbosa TaxID=529605 RepID=A0AAV1CJX7_OLDCO|nr:OLC1v1031735C3 [Oldenlandia corymbosa var. corymbosa]
MENLNLIRSSKWKRRLNPYQTPRSKSFAFILLFCTCSLLLFISSRFRFPKSVLNVSDDSLKSPLLPPPCGRIRNHIGQEKFLWYAPHSGFSNQLSEFKNALLMAAILNRTLIVPPILDHHAVALGSCPKFRVLSANELRYVSMTDIIDISSVVSDATIRVIDFRIFVSKWCNLDMGSVCPEVFETHLHGGKDSGLNSGFSDELRKCGLLLSGYNGNEDTCVHALDEDCRTTVWTYQKDNEDGVLDSFQPDDQLKKKKNISFVRRRKDVLKALGPGSEVDSARLLAFGSLFTAPYKGSESHIDIHEAPNDRHIQSLIDKIEFLPFVPEILNSGKEFALQKIKGPFLCAQLRLLDGQFKNHWKPTFLALKQKLESLKVKDPRPIHIFVMTDLPMSNWTGTYLGDLVKNSGDYKIFSLMGDDDLIKETARKLKNAAQKIDGCSPQSFNDILLYVEQAVCSCASLGFVGTAGSTIAETIELMRKYETCAG